MAFSKGKRIEDETSNRIVNLAVKIGCKEGPDALTVTRICRELSCDRRVIYNRFRDVDEINLIVADRCNKELIANARAAIDPEASYYDNFAALVKAIFTYICERNAFFQHYTALYKVTEDGIVINEILLDLIRLIEEGKEAGEVSKDTDSRATAGNIWLIITGITRLIASNANYKYQDGLNTVMHGVNAISLNMKP